MSGFDRVARPYRNLERCVFGSALQQVRLLGLCGIPPKGRILLLGDGDGRFLEALLRHRPQVEVVSIDGSPAMLALAAARVRSVSGGDERVTLLCGQVPEVLHREEVAETFDAVVTQFFLDCFSTEELDEWLPTVKQGLAPEGQWVIAEFAVPKSPIWWRMLSRALLWIMYRFFRIVTGLGCATLPDYAAAMNRAGFVLDSEAASLGGLLRSEVWRAT